jgi:STE24 endopeptidase
VRSIILGLMASVAIATVGPVFSQAEAPKTSSPNAAAAQTAAPSSTSTKAPAALTPKSGPRFDPVAATDAYITRLTPEQIAKSDAYFEGGYWLLLWNFLLTAGLCLILLTTGLSAGMRNLAERMVKYRWAQLLIYAVLCFSFITLLSLPLTIYEGYFREHQYDLSNQKFVPWLTELATLLGVMAVFGGVALLVFYAILRRAQKSWWIWASAAAIVFGAVSALVVPTYIEPLFNEYHALDDPVMRDQILSLARANQIPADRIYVFDASKQSKRVSANVNGALGTMRIALNDNLLNRCSPASVRSVMAHEMGHYVMNHMYKGLLASSVLITLGLAFCAWSLNRILPRRGAVWGIRSVDDPAGLPLILLLLTTYMFVLTPLTNTLTRTEEIEADAFGLNAAAEPDGFADAALILSEYRKMHPGKWEEIVFFDHPSGYNRILAAMTWKVEHPSSNSH